jgi:hypothetical protein
LTTLGTIIPGAQRVRDLRVRRLDDERAVIPNSGAVPDGCGPEQGSDSPASQIVERQPGVQPATEVRPGLPLRVTVQKDLVLGPYS